VTDQEEAVQKTIRRIYSIPCDIKGWTLTAEQWRDITEALQEVQNTIDQQRE
jgi:hypothetical protein